MSLLYNNASRLSNQLRKDLEQFSSGPGSTPPALIGQITTTLNNLGRTLRDYEEYIENQTLGLNEAQKLKNENRLKTLKEQQSAAKQEFEMLRKQREEAQAEANRSELFSSRATAVSDNPYDENGITSRRTQQQQQDQDQRMDVGMQDGLMNEQNVLERGNQQLDEILEMGRQAFDDLVEQNETVQKMRDRMTSSLETMGVSKATIRQIEKKAFEDKWIFYGGALLTLFLMWLIYHYLG